MQKNYGDFCSHHNESVSYYKEQVQSNKKLQYIMRVFILMNPNVLLLFLHSDKNNN